MVATLRVEAVFGLTVFGTCIALSRHGFFQERLASHRKEDNHNLEWTGWV